MGRRIRHQKNYGDLKALESGYAFFRGYVLKAPIVVDSDAELTDGMRVKFRYEK